jgi:hypothetical protein
MSPDAMTEADGDSTSATAELQALTRQSWAALMARGPRNVSALQQARHRSSGAPDDLSCFQAGCCMQHPGEVPHSSDKLGDTVMLLLYTGRHGRVPVPPIAIRDGVCSPAVQPGHCLA